MNTNKSLYEDKHPQTSTKGTGYKDKQKASDTLEIIKNRDLTYQKQVVNTMQQMPQLVQTAKRRNRV